MSAATAVVFDIETWVDWDFIRRPGFIEDLETQYPGAPGNYTDPVAIAAHHTAWWQKQREKWSLSPIYAKVCSIAWVDLWSEDEIAVVANESEEWVLDTFIGALNEAGPRILCGFNIKGFDMPFLQARCAVNNRELPYWWPAERDYRRVADIRDALGGSGSLDQWLDRCQLPPKMADGSMVETMPLEQIQEYNRTDVELERALAMRVAPNFPTLRDTIPEPDYSKVPL